MRDLVANDGCEPCVVLRDLEHASVHTDFSTRKGKGIRCWVFEYDELPMRTWEMDHRSESGCHAFELSIVARIVRNLLLPLHLGKLFGSYSIELRVGFDHFDMAVFVDSRRGCAGAKAKA